ncbi:MAG: DnaB-like helicase N-terminal domain-containing protein [Actinomycetota bacterium]
MGPPPVPNSNLLYDIATEAAVLGSSILSEEVRTKAVSTLREDDFGDEDHRGVFQLIASSVEDGHPVEPPALLRRANGMDFHRPLGSLLHQLVAEIAAPSSGLHYVETMLELRERRVLERTAMILSGVAKGPDPRSKRLLASMLLTEDDNLSESGIATPWPIMRPEAYDGLAGEVVAALSSETEADETGLLVTFLCQFGCMVGAGPHITLSGRQHPAKLFAVLIGDTGRSRKGAADSMISWLMRQVDPDFVMDRHETMPNSGEALVHQVRDEHDKDPGVDDKRLYVIDEEFASGLERMHRQGNSMSGYIRDAWDSKPLGGKSKQNPSVAKQSHICIMGHATMSELAGKLSSTDISNGFANRFLYIAVRSLKMLPFGGTLDTPELIALPVRIRSVVEDASNRGRLVFSADSRDWWTEKYAEMRRSIPNEGPLVGFLGRGDTYVQRLALFYALLDGSTYIELRHMTSAQAVWDYSRASVEYMIATTAPPPSGTDDDLNRLVELLVQHKHLIGSRARQLTGWSGQRLAVTRARGVRLRLIVEDEIRGARGGKPAKVMRLP